MTVYEEFGLPEGASMEEIRLAHRNLARILHPDNFQEEGLRRLAECQMKRVNAVYSGLLCEQPAPQPGIVTWRQPPLDLLRNNAGWIVGTIACLFAIQWILIPSAGSPVIEASSSLAVNTMGSMRSVPQTPKRSSIKPIEYSRLLKENERLRRLVNSKDSDPPLPLVPLPGPPPAMLTAAPSFIPPPSLAPAPVSPASQQAKPVPADILSGTWVYLPPSRPTQSDRYPAEYIELVIAQDSHSLTGRYRGRYRVADRALSPEVRFAFDGKPGEGNRFQWSGNGGAMGEIHLKTVTHNAISVEWFTSQFGPVPALGSGTAVLIRAAP